MSAIAAVRIRGNVHVRREVEDTLRCLGIARKNHCTVVQDTKEYRGMIFKAKDYITWGEVDEKTVASLLKSRGRVAGDKKLTDDYVKDNSKYSDITSYAAALTTGEAKIKDVKGLRNFFRLSPPKKGFERKGIKKPFKLKGALGYRGDKIGELLARMI